MKNNSKQNPLHKFIIHHLHEFIQIQNNIYNLYLICAAKKKEDETILIFYRAKVQQIISCNYFDLKQVLEEVVSRERVGVMMFERSLNKENYEKLFWSVLQSLEDINTNTNHKFYKDRKIQVEVIQSVISLLSVVLLKFKTFSGSVNKEMFIDFLNDIEESMAVAQKIKLETDDPNAKNQKFILKFHFHNPDEQKLQECTPLDVPNQNENKNANNETTNKTTRVSSLYKSSVSNSRMRRLNYTPSLRSSLNWKVVESELKKYFTDNKLSGSNADNFRCQTARLTRKVHKDESEQLKNGGHSENFNHSNHNNIRDSRQHSSISSKSEKNSCDFNKNGEDYIKEKTHSRHLSRQSHRSTVSYQNESNVKKKVPRLAMRINPNSEAMKTIHEFADELLKQNEKSQKISENMGPLETLNQNQKRKFKSQLINLDFPPSKLIRRYKNNNYRKKSFTKNKNEGDGLPENEKLKSFTSNENERKESAILLIKAPVEKNISRKSNLNQNEPHETTTFHLTFKQQRKGKIIKEGKDENENNSVLVDSTNIENKMESADFLSDDLFKIDIGEKNKIRAQFFHARIESSLIGSGNEENSIFFIEQEFLGHRENLRYQKYLKEMKEINGVEPRNPFNLETETIELQNEKLIEIERFQTFKSENEWIRQHYFVNNEHDFDQNGLCVKLQN